MNLFELSEEDFLRRLEDDMAITGDLGELFPRMVAYNVPYFVLSQYWPEERANLFKDPLFLAFCVAEAGWKGRLENLKGSLDLSSGRLTCEKTYVMQCDVMYILVWAGEDLALCRVPRNPSQIWTSRQEDTVRFVSKTGAVRDHFIVSVDQILKSEEYVTLRKRNYVRAGMTIPRREMTGLAIVALGYMRFLKEDVSDLIGLRDEVLQARATGELGAEAVHAASQIFHQLLRILPPDAHPFWGRAGSLFFQR